MPIPDPLLDALYRATSYEADTPAGRLRLRVDGRHPDLDELLVLHGVQTWAFVTADNPGSVPTPADLNRVAQQRLEEEVQAGGWAYYCGEGVGPDGTWPAEASLLVVGIGREEATALGHAYRQAAILFGEFGAAANLVWIADA